jgi:FKBP-type peptidyl-prolyl cis-trans isomerase FkpA
MTRHTAGLVPMLAATVALAACGTDPGPDTTPQTTDTGAAMAQSSITELIRDDVQEGDGPEAVPGREVTVHYTGWLWDEAREGHRGTQFDSSRDRNDPFTFRLGGGQVIRGWDEGVAGMKVGGRRTLTIPPAYGYGARGAPGAIPPNATLIFDVELLGVR